MIESVGTIRGSTRIPLFVAFGALLLSSCSRDIDKILPHAAPSAPSFVLVGEENGKIKISWTEVRDAFSYTVYYARKSSIDSSATEIADIQSESYTFSGLVNGESYSFYVTASNDLGESPSSQAVSATAGLSPIFTKGNTWVYNYYHQGHSWGPNNWGSYHWPYNPIIDTLRGEKNDRHRFGPATCGYGVHIPHC